MWASAGSFIAFAMALNVVPVPDQRKQIFACLAAVQVSCRLQAGKRPALAEETVEINNFPSKIKLTVIIMLNHTVKHYEWRQLPDLIQWGDPLNSKGHQGTKVE